MRPQLNWALSALPGHKASPVHPQNQTELPDGGLQSHCQVLAYRESTSKPLAAQEGFPGLSHAYFGALGRAMPRSQADFRPPNTGGWCVVGNNNF